MTKSNEVTTRDAWPGRWKGDFTMKMKVQRGEEGLGHTKANERGRQLLLARGMARLSQPLGQNS